jgi:uncharacterized damage-inducible protein DinB
MQPTEIVQVLAGMEDWFNRSTRALTEEDSSFAPVPGTFTAAAQVAHTAQTIEWFFEGAFSPQGFDMDFQKHDQAVRGCVSLAAAREWFKKAIESAKACALAHSAAEWEAKMTPNPILGEIPHDKIVGACMDHTAHHRGALTVYARLLGKVPPMPYGDM